MAEHPAWHLPLGYVRKANGEFGPEQVPSGAYLGDRDLFLFIVDGNRAIDDPSDSTHAGLFRGMILRNSDVGAAAISIHLFLFRAVCGNHLIWGFQHVATFRRAHVSESIHDAWEASLQRARDALDSDTADQRATLRRAAAVELGTSRDAVIDIVTQRLDLSRKRAEEAYNLAERHDNPRSIWGYVQGLTSLSQRTPWQDARFALDRAAGRLLASVN
jgi:hypothetical protein